MLPVKSLHIPKVKASLGIATDNVGQVSPNLSRFTRRVSHSGAQLFAIRRRSLYPLSYEGVNPEYISILSFILTFSMGVIK